MLLGVQKEFQQEGDLKTMWLKGRLEDLTTWVKIYPKINQIPKNMEEAIKIYLSIFFLYIIYIVMFLNMHWPSSVHLN